MKYLILLSILSLTSRCVGQVKYDTVHLPSQPPCGGMGHIGQDPYESADDFEKRMQKCLNDWMETGTYYCRKSVKTLVDNGQEIVYLIPVEVKNLKHTKKHFKNKNHIK